MSTDEPSEPGDARRERRDRAADDREASLDERESHIAAVEADISDRADEVERVLSDAEDRDELAEARDRSADNREHAESLASFVKPTEFGDAIKARRASALNRQDSKTDRAASADDRTTLSDG